MKLQLNPRARRDIVPFKVNERDDDNNKGESKGGSYKEAKHVDMKRRGEGRENLLISID